MIIEMKEEGLNFESEKEITFYYKNKIVGKRRANFFVEQVVSVEIKVISALHDSNLNQRLNYLDAFKIEVGLLLNFGSKNFQFKRLINSKK